MPIRLKSLHPDRATRLVTAGIDTISFLSRQSYCINGSGGAKWSVPPFLPLATSNIEKEILAAMNDDMNTPQVIAQLFEAVRVANSAKDGSILLDQHNIELLNHIFSTYAFKILGLREETGDNNKAQDVSR